MQRPCLVPVFLIVTTLLAGCGGSPAVMATAPASERAVPSPAGPSTSPSPACLSPALKMSAERAAHSATLLPDGRVLIAGGFREEGTSEVAIASAELFDPAARAFTPTDDMTEPRNGHTATRLPDGTVLLTGGWNRHGRTATAELYNPQTGTFELIASLMAPRQGHTATLLQNGLVLIAGGDSARNSPQSTAELYDPATGKFTPTGDLEEARSSHTATLLGDGTVLLVGGTAGNDRILASAEIYDPRSGRFTSTGTASIVRYKHASVLLPDGDVLILGGADQGDWRGQYESAEIYDASSRTFRQISSLNQARFKLAEAAVLLPDGNVLIGGGHRQIEIFDSQHQVFIPGGVLDDAYYFSVLTALEDGRVLITGGYSRNILPSDRAWLYCG